MRIGGDYHEFILSAVMGSQFSYFLLAVYCLYDESDYNHGNNYRRWTDLKREYPHNRKDKKYSTCVELFWDGEMYGCEKITLLRESPVITTMPIGVPDPISIIIGFNNPKRYDIDGRDLCYAVAKAYTAVLKKYGIKGFEKSCGNQYLGDSVDMEKLLFVKAYALDALDVRKTELAWRNPNGWEKAQHSSFEKEIELLLFEM